MSDPIDHKELGQSNEEEPKHEEPEHASAGHPVSSKHC